MIRHQGRLVVGVPLALVCSLGKCIGEVAVTVEPGYQDRFAFAVVDGGAVRGAARVSFALDRDHLLAVRSQLSRALQIVAAIPAGLGVFLAFYSDIVRVLRRALTALAPRRRDDDPPPGGGNRQ